MALGKLGVPEDTISVIRSSNENMKTQICVNAELLERVTLRMVCAKVVRWLLYSFQLIVLLSHGNMEKTSTRTY